MYRDKKISVIVPAAGSGKRMNSNINKQFIEIGDKPVLAYTLENINSNDFVDEIIVIVKYEEIDYCKKEIIEKYEISKVKNLIIGGKERQDSVYNGIISTSEDMDIILIHDGARPFVNNEIIDNIVKEVYVHKCVVTGVPVKDTVKEIKEEFISSTLERDKLCLIQTPQGFDKGILLEAYERAYRDNYYGTDDSVLVERLGYDVKVVEGNYNNIKITTKEDLLMANYLTEKEIQKVIKTGMGYDAHRLVENRKLILGGVDIPYEKGLLGHSDADVLIHSIIDAILGACALGDIGKLFPDTDATFKDISSIILLKETAKTIKEKGYRIINIDSIIIAQKPKMQPHIELMRKNISEVLNLDINNVSVKATTTEGMGFAGREEGIAVQAIASIEETINS